MSHKKEGELSGLSTYRRKSSQRKLLLHGPLPCPLPCWMKRQKYKQTVLILDSYQLQSLPFRLISSAPPHRLPEDHLGLAHSTGPGCSGGLCEFAVRGSIYLSEYPGRFYTKKKILGGKAHTTHTGLTCRCWGDRFWSRNEPLERPESTVGWVLKNCHTMGYSAVRNNSKLKTPPSYGDCEGPATTTLKYR